MITLLSDTFAPTTSTIGFLGVPLEVAADGLVDWRRRLHQQVDSRAVRGPLTVLIQELEPLTGGVRPRELLVATNSPEWTAYLDCGIGGTDADPTIGYLAEKLLCNGVVASSIPHTYGTSLEEPGRYGGVQLSIYGPVKTDDFLNRVRVISAIHDGQRWQFDAEGVVQEFEQVEAYRSRKVRDRFTSHMLAEYCAALGLQPFDSDFYKDRGILVENNVEVPQAGKILSIAETQKWLGIRPGVAPSVQG